MMCQKLQQVLRPFMEKEEASEDLPEMEPEELQEAYEALKEFAAAFDYDDMIYVLESLSDKKPPEAEKEHWAAVVKAARQPDWETLRGLLS